MVFLGAKTRRERRGGRVQDPPVGRGLISLIFQDLLLKEALCPLQMSWL